MILERRILKHYLFQEGNLIRVESLTDLSYNKELIFHQKR
jgi:hypothetical protein